MRHLSIVLCAVLFSGAACADYSDDVDGTTALRGSGRGQTQPRPLPGFDNIECRAPVRLDIAIAEEPALEVTIDDNLQGRIVTRVEHHTLVIESSGGWRSDNQPRVHIALPQLASLELLGSAEASVRGLAGGNLTAKILGSGDLEASGETGELMLLIEGSGDAELQNLQAQSARVRIDGGGRAHLDVVRKLDAMVNGDGSVRYRGGPALTRKIHGNGEIEAE
jgi:hypothetical protein